MIIHKIKLNKYSDVFKKVINNPAMVCGSVLKCGEELFAFANSSSLVIFLIGCFIGSCAKLGVCGADAAQSIPIAFARFRSLQARD